MAEDRNHVLNEHKASVNSRRARSSRLWVVSTFVLLGVLVAVLARGGYLSGVGEKQISQKTADFINKEVLAGSAKATVGAVTKLNPYLYEVKLSIGPQEFKSYVSADGKYLFPSAFEMGASKKSEEQSFPKSDKPVMNLFVMSQCPYGVQAEQSMLEVVKSLGNKIKLNINYIAEQASDGKFRSLHGQPEVDEDMRQVCIASKNPEKLYSYLECVNKDPRNAENIWEQCAAKAGIDVAAVKDCFGNEGKQLLADNIKLASAKNIGASPTIEINGVSYKGGRSADEFKSALCSAFTTTPVECGGKLSSETEIPSGQC